MTYCPKFAAVFLAGLVVTTSAGLISPAMAQTFVGTNVDERLTLALQVDEAAAQAWLPDGWVVAPAVSGPFAGANLMAVFLDRLLQLDAEGEPSGGGMFRLMALVVPAKRADTQETAPMIIRAYTAHDGTGPYKVFVKADVSREVTTNGANVGGGGGSETWQVDAASGGSVTLNVEYQRDVPTPQTKEIRLRSAVDPDFFRIYRVNQIIDVVNSGPAGIDRAPSYKLSVSIPELSDMFDGTETLVGIIVIPSYARQTYLP